MLEFIPNGPGKYEARQGPLIITIAHRSCFCGISAAGYMLYIVNEKAGETVFLKGSGSSWDHPFKTYDDAEGFINKHAIAIRRNTGEPTT